LIFPTGQNLTTVHELDSTSSLRANRPIEDEDDDEDEND
jgi:hypothetical protein